MDAESEALHLARSGAAHRRQGRYDQAHSLFMQSLALDADQIEATVGIAELLCLRGNPAAAASRLERLVERHPDWPRAWSALADIEFERGKYRSALGYYERVLDIDPEQIDSRIGLARCLSRQPTLALHLNTRHHLTDTLDNDAVDPSLLAPAVQLLLHDSPAPLEDPLLLTLLRQAIVTDPLLEATLVAYRRRVCLEPPPRRPEWAEAVSQQCRLNEFVWPVTAEEQACLPHGPQWVRDMYSSGPDPELREIAATIPALATSHDPVSAAVQELYEANPYPRWARLSRGARQPLREHLRALTYGRWEPPEFLERPRILVAGCGTGQELLGAACQWQPASITGVDLSRTSLAYARKQAQELGIEVELLQGDLTQCGGWDREFDAIVCTGVLHHLQDPLAGWRSLRRLLRPGGVMLIGLYSGTARVGISAAQQRAQEAGLEPTPEGISEARSLILGLPPDDPARECLQLQDFYYLSGCRDLLFHVQEQYFDLPGVTAALDDLGLEFLDFESPARPVYRTLFGTRPSLVSWESLERMYPRTFLGMYQFWCRAPG